ncbi:unnamed protein product [Amoebophrya sp. A120]|nr:unnamed protein product [Amoebophrya sp. A120]|eukprot:GSA120T00008520001.1
MKKMPPTICRRSHAPDRPWRAYLVPAFVLWVQCVEISRSGTSTLARAEEGAAAAPVPSRQASSAESPPPPGTPTTSNTNSISPQEQYINHCMAVHDQVDEDYRAVYCATRQAIDQINKHNLEVENQEHAAAQLQTQAAASSDAAGAGTSSSPAVTQHQVAPNTKPRPASTTPRQHLVILDFFLGWGGYMQAIWRALADANMDGSNNLQKNVLYAGFETERWNVETLVLQKVAELCQAMQNQAKEAENQYGFAFHENHGVINVNTECNVTFVDGSTGGLPRVDSVQEYFGQFMLAKEPPPGTSDSSAADVCGGDAGRSQLHSAEDKDPVAALMPQNLLPRQQAALRTADGMRTDRKSFADVTHHPARNLLRQVIPEAVKRHIHDVRVVATDTLEGPADGMAILTRDPSGDEAATCSTSPSTATSISKNTDKAPLPPPPPPPLQKLIEESINYQIQTVLRRRKDETTTATYEDASYQVTSPQAGQIDAFLIWGAAYPMLLSEKLGPNSYNSVGPRYSDGERAMIQDLLKLSYQFAHVAQVCKGLRSVAGSTNGNATSSSTTNEKSASQSVTAAVPPIDVKILTFFDAPSAMAPEWSLLEKFCSPDFVYLNNINLPNHPGWIHERLTRMRRNPDGTERSRYKEIYRGEYPDSDAFESGDMVRGELYGKRLYAVLMKE